MQYTGLIIMGMASALSESVAKHVARVSKSSRIGIERQHYQVIENRIEPTEDDQIYIQRINANTGNNKQTAIHSSNSKGQISNREYHIYQQEIPINGFYGRFIYCIGIEDTKDSVKTVCIIVLNQTTSGDELDGRSSFNYGVAMFYINIPLQKTVTGQLEELSDTELKKHIIQASTEWDSFLESVKTVSFNSGRVWEMPIQFTGHEMAHLSIHEPLSKPSVLNVVLQKYDGIGVSHILSIRSIPD
jgi:hypothetical protein